MNRYMVCVVKGDERYIVLYSSEHRQSAYHTVGRWAGDVALRFSWYDAAIMSSKFRQQADAEKLLQCRGR